MTLGCIRKRLNKSVDRDAVVPSTQMMSGGELQRKLEETGTDRFYLYSRVRKATRRTGRWSSITRSTTSRRSRGAFPKTLARTRLSLRSCTHTNASNKVRVVKRWRAWNGDHTRSIRTICDVDVGTHARSSLRCRQCGWKRQLLVSSLERSTDLSEM